MSFARDNGGEPLTEASVLGTSLWKYVSGAEVRHVYGHLFRRGRSGAAMAFPFRCDSPTIRRFHEMRMGSLEAGEIEVSCYLLREEQRATGPMALLDTGVPRGTELITMCGLVLEVPEAAGRLART